MDLDNLLYYRHLEKENIENKEQLLGVINNIDDSFTGRSDVMSLHVFFMESANMLKNSIKQLELGFFDAAFYSVRSAVEISRVLVRVSIEDVPIESELYQKWINLQRFPFDGNIKQQLKEMNLVYEEIRCSFSDFFSEQYERLGIVNKYIHKQGYKTFYQPNSIVEVLNKRKEERKSLFVEFINNSIIEIILLRLCIDPFPLLLNDEEIMYKIHFQSMTFPFKEDTLEFLGKDFIDKYKKTEFYKGHLNMFQGNESMTEGTYNIVNHEYYEREKWDEVKEQLHLLTKDAIRAVKIFNLLEDATRIYFVNGFISYYSNTPSLRTESSFNSKKLTDLKLKQKKINTDYDGAFLSYFDSDGEDIWVVHNSELDQNQIEDILKIR